MKMLFEGVVESPKLRFLVGLALLIGALASGMLYLKNIRYNKQYQFFPASVKSLPNEIMVGSPISLFGLEVGKIEGITINSQYDGIDLSISVLKEISQKMTKDASLTIIPKLFGSPELILDLGASPEMFGIGNAIPLMVEKSADHLVRENLKLLYENIIPEISAGVNNFSRVGERLNKIDLDGVGPMINGLKENMAQISGFVSSMNEIQGDLKKMMFKMDAAMGNVVDFTGKISKFAENTLEGEEDLGSAIKRIVNNTSGVIQNVNNLSSKTEVLLGHFEGTGADLKKISADLNKFTENLPALSESINTMVDDFSIVGLALQRHWLLKGYVKRLKKDVEEEKIKLR